MTVAPLSSKKRLITKSDDFKEEFSEKIRALFDSYSEKISGSFHLRSRYFILRINDFMYFKNCFKVHNLKVK